MKHRYISALNNKSQLYIGMLIIMIFKHLLCVHVIFRNTYILLHNRMSVFCFRIPYLDPWRIFFLDSAKGIMFDQFTLVG